MDNQSVKEAIEENVIVVECLNDFLQAINDMRKQIREAEGEDADNQHFFFRGQANSEWDVIPGIFRGNMLAFESELIHMAYLRNPSEFRNLGTDFERLTKLQHYGLPTRLLDVTSNPMVALYFACQSHKESRINGEDEKEYSEPTDGAVFYQRAYCKGYDELEIVLISHLAGLDLHGDMTLEHFLGELEEKGIYSSKSAENCRKMNYRSLIESLQNNYFVISNLNNERLIRQSGAFLVCGQYNITIDQSSIGNSVLQKANGGLRSEFDDMYFRIPFDKKKEILEELDFYNINEGALFPELEHQMTYIKSAQTGKTLQNVGRFVKVSTDAVIGLPIAGSKNDWTDEQIERFVNETLDQYIEPELYHICLDSLKSNMVVDWYKRENILSKMRLDLTRKLETTALYDRTTAREKAQEIVDAIVWKLI